MGLHLGVGFNSLVAGRLTLATVVWFWFQFLASAAVSGWRVVLLFPCRVWLASIYITLASLSLSGTFNLPFGCYLRLTGTGTHLPNRKRWPSSNRLGRIPLDRSCPNLHNAFINCFVTCPWKACQPSWSTEALQAWLESPVCSRSTWRRPACRTSEVGSNSTRTCKNKWWLFAETLEPGGMPVCKMGLNYQREQTMKSQAVFQWCHILSRWLWVQLYFS